MLSKTAFKRLVKQCIAEVVTEQEMYDAETDTFAPGPRDRTEPVKPAPMRGPTAVYIKSGPNAGKTVFAHKDAQGNYYYRNPDTGTMVPLGGAADISEANHRLVKENAPGYTVQYAVAGLEGIAPSKHAKKDEAWNAARSFVQSYNSKKAKNAGEYIEGLTNGYAIKHIGGGTVAIATISPSQGLFEIAAAQGDRLSASERKLIGKAFAERGLDGNGRFEKKEHGLSAITDALHTLGFQLDMVSGDLIMGDKGTRAFIYRRANDQGQDPFTEKPEIQNSRIVFNWELLSPGKFEVLAYAS